MFYKSTGICILYLAKKCIIYCLFNLNFNQIFAFENKVISLDLKFGLFLFLENSVVEQFLVFPYLNSYLSFRLDLRYQLYLN